MIIKNSRKITAITAMCALMLTACSKTTSTDNATAATVDTAAAALVPAEYQGATLIAGVDTSYAPDEFVDEAGKIVGFDIDLMDALATTLDIKVKHVSATFDNIIPGIQSGQYTIGNSSFTDNVERQKSVTFVDYFRAGEAFYVKNGTDPIYDSLESLCGISVAVESGTVEETDAQAQSKKCPADMKLTVHSYGDQNAANVAISSGRDMVGFLDSQVAGYVVAQSGGKFVLSGKPFGIAPYGIAVAKTDQGMKLALALQEGFKVLHANGVYNQILTKWGVQDGAVDSVDGFVINGATS